MDLNTDQLLDPIAFVVSFAGKTMNFQNHLQCGNPVANSLDETRNSSDGTLSHKPRSPQSALSSIELQFSITVNRPPLILFLHT